MKKILISAVSTMLLTAPAFAEAPQAAPQAPAAPLVIGSGVVTGLYFPTAGMIQRLANDQAEATQSATRFAVESTAGTMDNLKALKSGEIALAIAQSDKVAEDAKTNPALRSVMALHPETLAIVVKNDSPIKSFSDLKGKAFNLGPDGSSPRLVMSALTAALEWAPADSAKATSLPLADQATALCLGSVEAISYVVPHPNAAVAQAMTQCPTRLVPLLPSEVSALTAKNAAYMAGTIRAGDYSGMGVDVPSVGVRAMLVTTDKVPAAAVELLVNAVLTNQAAMGLVHTSLANLSEADVKAAETVVPLHEGAKTAVAALEALAPKVEPSVPAAAAAPQETAPQQAAPQQAAPKVDEPAPPAP